MSTSKKYWKGIEELNGDESFLESKDQEFNSYQKPSEFLGDEEVESFKTDRRDFLKYLGFGVTAATLAACEAPVQKAIPYVIKPEEVEPGLANFYASTYYDGTDFASVLVKTREGRPIFISGNKASKLTNGGVNARVNSSVLSLYDSKRANGFMKKDGETFTNVSHNDLDKAVLDQLDRVVANRGNITLLTETIISPSTMAAISAFKTKFEGEEGNGATVNHVMYDAISRSGALDAHKALFDKRALPFYDYTKAKVIVSVGSDFIQNEVNSIAYASDYASRRNPDNDWMSRHFQFESSMTVTGSNSDYRTLVSPAEQNSVIAHLYNEITGSSVEAGSLNDKAKQRVQKAAADLKAAKGSSIVIAGSNDMNAQLLVAGINQALNNYGSTLNMDKAVHLKKGNDLAFANLVMDMNAGKVDALLIHGVNPVYSAASFGFAEGLEKVAFKLSFADRVTEETASLCDFLATDNHYLESWNDFMPIEGEYSFQQPTIKPLYETRQFQESLLTWAGQNVKFYDFIKSNWNAKKPDVMGVAFDNNFNQMIHDGVYTASSTNMEVSQDVMSDDLEETPSVDFSSAASKLNANVGEWQVEFYVSTAMGDGSHAANPWLQELPDPLTKITWDNYIAMSPSKMTDLGFNTMMGQKQMSNVATLTVNGKSVNLPVVAQPGMPANTVAVAIGYGRECGYEESMTVGSSVAELMQLVNGYVSNYAFDAQLTATEETYSVASTQTHHTMMGRKIVNEVNKDTYDNVAHDDMIVGWNKPTKVLDSYGEAQNPDDLNLWSDHGIDFGHRWGMSIDLNKCTGCSACVTACNSENNVPVVGKDEVNRARDMHWMRIDRYYTTDEGETKAGTEEQYSYDYAALEVPQDEPKVVHQPVMCQHCNHAPCETVCPVAATTHSDEGLNQMAYNRCFGTRYCANNCPYKVRRFNWFNYTAYKKFGNFNPSQDDMGRMVLNPDVVVRTRGVMEKCSMCVQRIQSGKLDAKKAGKPVQDGAIQTACSEACSFGAITFGDINDKGSQIRSEAQHKRAYHLIEEIGVQPNIWYQTKVRNIEEEA